ncbi:MAG: hypothetical protein K2H00_01380 [Muribaculum intestinale]|nr:hypothetical protein [Muribaculum intestinale]
MKHKFLHLQSLVSVALCIIMAMTFTGCSDDDEEPTGDELTSIIVGVWAQDGDNDIFVVNANGPGEVYDSPELYEQKKDGASFVWTYKDGWVKAGIAGVQEEEMRAESVSKNKIVWRRYDKEVSTDDGYEKDAFGYYELWIWERYTK